MTLEYEVIATRRSAVHTIRGVDYHVSEWGDKNEPLLVLLHGWGDTGSSFQFFVDALTEKRFVIAPDWRGFGETRCRAESYWFPDYIADLDSLLDIYSKDRPACLLGHSMGANVAGLYAGVMPERVSALINVEGFGLAESDPGNAPANYRRWLEKSKAGQPYRTYSDIDELAVRIRKRSPRMSEGQARFVAGRWGEQTGNGEIVIRADPAHRLPNAVQYRRAEAEACWAKITAATLAVTGGDSEFFTAAANWSSAADAASFKDAATAEIADAGHMVHFEQPGRLAAAVEAFLARVT